MGLIGEDGFLSLVGLCTLTRLVFNVVSSWSFCFHNLEKKNNQRCRAFSVTLS